MRRTCGTCTTANYCWTHNFMAAPVNGLHGRWSCEEDHPSRKTLWHKHKHTWKLAYILRSLRILPKWTASHKQEHPPPKKSADIEHSGGAENEHGVSPPVNTAARTPNPGLYIYSPSCVHLCMFVCARRGKQVCGSESPAGVWGKTQQEAENPPLPLD